MNYIAVLYLDFEYVTLVFISKELLYSLSRKDIKRKRKEGLKVKRKKKKLKTKNKSTILFLNGNPN